jgi:DNA polymerase/3'-5' exonuclease PolX
MDNLHKVLCIYRQPGTGIKRQVDLVMTPLNNLAVALVGWTGSTLYERSLRLYCKRGIKGYHFSSDGLFKITGEKVQVDSERHFYEILQLPYYEPWLRNA